MTRHLLALAAVAAMVPAALVAQSRPAPALNGEP
jgi:hypothetical protein